jgi:hypothetical protein
LGGRGVYSTISYLSDFGTPAGSLGALLFALLQRVGHSSSFSSLVAMTREAQVPQVRSLNLGLGFAPRYLPLSVQQVTTIPKIGNSLSVVLPKEAVNRLHAGIGLLQMEAPNSPTVLGNARPTIPPSKRK